MPVWQIILIAVFVHLGVLFVVAAISTVGLERNQKHVKQTYRVMGLVGIAYGLSGGDWLYLILGTFALILSHRKVNLPKLSRRIDKSLGEKTDNPAHYVP